MDQIIAAKERQTAEANRAANNLLQEIDLEKSREQTRKEAAAKKREKRKAKKKDKHKVSNNESLLPPATTPAAIDEEEQAVFSATVLPSVQENQIVSVESVSCTGVKSSKSASKKKTNTMVRKIERIQGNLVSKSKQTMDNSINPSTGSIDDDCWQEVSGKQKKMTIPQDQYERVIGKDGTNLSLLRDTTGASIEVENKRAVGDKTILIK